MTLLDASREITPILKSGLLGRTPELDEKMKVVEDFLKSYGLKGPLRLRRFEILDMEIESAVKELLKSYVEAKDC